MKNNYRYFVFPLVLGIVLGFLGSNLWNSRGDHRDQDNNMSNSSSGLVSTTEITAHPKESSSDPDVVLSQTYTAVVNGEKVSVPVVKTVSNTTSKPSSTPGVVPNQTQGLITQSIDLTPLLSKLTPRWEVGAGYMYYNGDHCAALSLQRNYKTNKAIELTCFVSSDNRNLKGGMVMHKWLIK